MEMCCELPLQVPFGRGNGGYGKGGERSSGVGGAESSGARGERSPRDVEGVFSDGVVEKDDFRLSSMRRQMIKFPSEVMP